tara:strand:+ start:360 stop:1127 length:768 start_codon:yes stop_codon:yes gene_type:complete
MAKKNDAAYDQFLADLKAINPQFEEIVKDEKVSAKLREGVLARADYSSHMDTLRNERETFAVEVQEARQKIQGWQSWYGQATEQVASVQGKLQEYETLYGPIQAGEKREVARAMGISKEEMDRALEDRMNQRDIAALKFADDLTDIKMDFKDKFKEKLDTTAVFRLAGERGVDLNTAYNLHIADRLEDVRTKDVEERISRARQEAVSEYASQHNLPVTPSSNDIVHVLDAKNVSTNARDRVAAAVASMNASRRAS